MGWIYNQPAASTRAKPYKAIRPTLFIGSTIGFRRPCRPKPKPQPWHSPPCQLTAFPRQGLFCSKKPPTAASFFLPTTSAAKPTKYEVRVLPVCCSTGQCYNARSASKGLSPSSMPGNPGAISTNGLWEAVSVQLFRPKAIPWLIFHTLNIYTKT